MRRIFGFALLLFLVFLACPVFAQIPRTFTNLQVLPRDISRAELIATMRGFAGALGVRCTHCHVGPDNLQGMDFATDEKLTKQIARTMLRMVRSMNAKYLSKLPAREAPRQEVGCLMCHRREQQPPRPLDQILLATVKERGVDAGAAEYRTLRKDQFGSGLYDFRQPTLNIVATRLREEKRFEDAIAILKLNAEMFPESADVQANLGEASREKGDLDDAESYYKRALAMQPDHPWAGEALKQLEAKRQYKSQEKK